MSYWYRNRPVPLRFSLSKYLAYFYLMSSFYLPLNQALSWKCYVSVIRFIELLSIQFFKEKWMIVVCYSETEFFFKCLSHFVRTSCWTVQEQSIISLVMDITNLCEDNSNNLARLMYRYDTGSSNNKKWLQFYFNKKYQTRI